MDTLDIVTDELKLLETGRNLIVEFLEKERRVQLSQLRGCLFNHSNRIGKLTDAIVGSAYLKQLIIPLDEDMEDSSFRIYDSTRFELR